MESNADFAMGYTMGDRTNGGYGNGMYGMEWLFALLILPMMWGGGFGSFGNRGCNPVTEAGLCDAMNSNNLQNAVGRLSDTVQAGQRQTDNAVCNLGYQALSLANQTQRDLCAGFTSVTGAINQARFEDQACCCETQRLIQQGQYQDAINTAAINANTTSGIQKILDKLSENETNALRARVQQLELQGALCGVPRYLPGTVYGSTPCNPFAGVGSGCSCGCGC